MKLDSSPKPGTFTGCPISLPQCIVRDVIHVVEASRAPTVEIPPREVKKASQTAWPNVICHIEDEASSESDKKVEWYSNCHDNLMDDLRLAEEKASAE